MLSPTFDPNTTNKVLVSGFTALLTHSSVTSFNDTVTSILDRFGDAGFSPEEVVALLASSVIPKIYYESIADRHIHMQALGRRC